MHYTVLETIDYRVYGEMRKAYKGDEIYIPVRSVAKELEKQKKIKLQDLPGVPVADMGKKPVVPKNDEPKIPLRVGGLVTIDGEEGVATVLEILNKQIKVEYTTGETKRVSMARIVEVLD